MLKYEHTMKMATIKISEETKKGLEHFKSQHLKSYDDILKLLINVARDFEDEELSKETLERIQEARARIAQGIYFTEEKAKKRLNL